MRHEQNKQLVRFSTEDLELFSVASHDKNPLHLSADYARRTAYGDRVVFGVLGGLACLGRLKFRPNSCLSTITLDFPSPMFPAVDYTIRATDISPEQTSVTVYDGSRSVLKASALFQKCGAISPILSCPPIARRGEPFVSADSDLFPGFAIEDVYSPSNEELQEVIQRTEVRDKGITQIQAIACMFCSYFIGMELPGREALFSRLSLNFFDDAWKAGESRLAYCARVAVFDRRFELLRIAVSLKCQGVPLATGELRSFVRRKLRFGIGSVENIATPISETLKNKVALVIGASRGLGAAIVSSLVRQGCTVIANFMKSTTEAEILTKSLEDSPGRIMLIQADASDPGYCADMERKILQAYGGLDFLICNAGLPLLPLWLEPDAIRRVNEYVGKSLALVSVPLATFLQRISARSGRCVVTSSSAVQSPVAAWPHYISAKYAIEGIVKTAAKEYQNVSFLIVRPPRLLTDMTNIPLGYQGAIAPEIVAAEIAKRLGRDSATGFVEFLEGFDGSTA